MHLPENIGMAAAPLGDWTPGFHDPTALDWAITLGYLVAAVFCFYARWTDKTAGADARSHVRGFWLVVGIVMILLGINKQLNFQTLVTDVGRGAAEQQGWYERRRTVQRLFVVGFTGVGITAVVALGWWVRRAWKTYVIALAGLLLSGMYAVVRAASFHHVLAQREAGPHHPISQELLEVGAIVLVIVGGWQAARAAPSDFRPKLQAHERIVRIR